MFGIVGVIQRIRRREIRRRCGNKASLFGRMDQRTLRLFGHVDKMEEGRLKKNIFRAEMDGLGEGVGER